MELVDSGSRVTLESGALKEAIEGKGRCDLLPLDIVDMVIGSKVLTPIGDFIYGGTPDSLLLCLREFGKERNWTSCLAMLEAAHQYEDGAKKYKPRNWENGINLHILLDSAVRHFLKWRDGWTDEPHDRAFVWNILGALWTYYHKAEVVELMDIPYFMKE